MKKIIITSLLTIASIIGFSQANTYFHDRVDTTIFGVADTVGHGANNYVVTNASPDFNVKQYVNGLAINVFVKHGNTGSITLRLITRTGTLPTRVVEKANGAQLQPGDIKDSALVLFTFYNTRFRVDVSPAMSPAWQLLGNSGTVAGTNFQGTIDSVDAVYKTNNIERERITANGGNVGINTSNPKFKLDVRGSINDSITYNWRDTAFYYQTPDFTNEFLGDGCGNSTMTGTWNESFAPYGFQNNTTGRCNVSFGWRALKANTTAKQIVAVGIDALRKNTTGDNNVALGYATLENNRTGHENVSVGELSGTNITTGSNNIAIGANAIGLNLPGLNGIATNNTAIGGSSGNNLRDGGNNTSIGANSLTKDSSGTDNTAVGYNSLNLATGINNVAIGSNSLASQTTVGNNTAVGFNALTNNITGVQLVAVGSGALQNNTNNNNTAIGSTSLNRNTSGSDNTAIGDNALGNNTTGNFCTVAGSSACETSNANKETVFGYFAGEGLTGANNNAFGANSMQRTMSGTDNCTFGSSSLFGNAGAGSNNTCIGNYSLQLGSNITGCVAIGFSSGTYNTASNQFYVNNKDQGSEVNDNANSLLHGVFGANASAQSLSVNALHINVSYLQTYANNAAALAGGLVAGDMYLVNDGVTGSKIIEVVQ